MILPRAGEVVIPEGKFRDYALDEKRDYDKAVAFDLALGYSVANYKELIENIRENVARFQARERGNKGYGMTYEVIMRLCGANGKVANVLTAWLDDAETGEMRLTTAHVDK